MSVGLACRVPGASSPDELWRLLSNGIEWIADEPHDGRFWDLLSASGITEPERRMVERGGYLSDMDKFDASFFGIAPREAQSMDPQQRLVLELSWEALEHGGIIAAAINGMEAGIFIPLELLDRFLKTGGGRSMVANHVSRFFGLHGPGMSVDCGQYSSLVAVHLACECIRSGESVLALAGGVHLNLSSGSGVGMLKFGALCPDGRSFVFDARAA
ncbi:polyketide synthase [Nocardia sp. NPDC059091]|uniref:beta-ketoacyl [acyl carrier protein] synthase domain-containing protein n=1 Tax=Nocardia sp. NPDC059091 TaxID=3346724 RepID=UPI0036AEF452